MESAVPIWPPLVTRYEVVIADFRLCRNRLSALNRDSRTREDQCCAAAYFESAALIEWRM